MTITDTFKKFADELDFTKNETQGPFRVQIFSGYVYTNRIGEEYFSTSVEDLGSCALNVRKTKRVFVWSAGGCFIYSEDVPHGSDVKEYVRYLNSRWIRWTLGETQ